MDIVAVQKFLIASPKKLREVTFLIKGMSPEDAVARLPFTGKRAAGDLRKVIMTALANAKQREVSPGDLHFKEIQINEGPRLKRFQAGARGRAKPYKKRMSHIRIVLTTDVATKKGNKKAKVEAAKPVEVKEAEIVEPKKAKSVAKTTKKEVKTKK